MQCSSIDIELLQTIPDPRFEQDRLEASLATTSLPTGHLIDGRYVIIGEIDRGSMGVVYEAFDANRSYTVALKVLSPELVAQRDCLERFRREIRSASLVSHPNVCRLLDTGTCTDGTPFLVMEMLRGMTLTELIARWGRLPEERIVPLVLDLLCGLDAAHRQGIVHRDVKPDNIFLDYSQGGRERVKLLDFGISKTLDAAVALTSSGIVLGTPLYMSPEQIRGGVVDQRSDIWGVGVVLYEAISGCFPFDPSSLRSLFLSISYATPTLLRDVVPGMNPHLEAVIFKALEKDPRRRYHDTSDLAGALRAAMRARGVMM